MGYIFPMIIFLFMIVAFGIAIYQKNKKEEDKTPEDYNEMIHLGP